MSALTGSVRIEDLPALFARGEHAALEAAARDWLAHAPDNGMAWKALGVALAAQGRSAEAIQAKQRAVAFLPGDIEAHLNLGHALLADGDATGAVAAYQAATRLDPATPQRWQLLARAMRAAGWIEEAIACLQQVCALEPESAEAWADLGNLQREQQRFEGSVESYRRALAIEPQHAAAATNLGNSLKDLGHWTEAELWYRRALAWHPGIAEIHSNLANLLTDLGQLQEAQAAYRQAMALQPQFLSGHSNLLMALHYDGQVGVDALRAEAHAFGERCMARAGAPQASAPARARTGQPLRVGFVSADFCHHPVGYFLQGWLPHVDASRLELHAYHALPKQDPLTGELRQHFRGWHPIHGLGDEEAARLIRQHGLDVLVDLAGHTGHNRLGVFAWRPAPVQATWLGYFATTGLPAMDWLIADETSVPSHERWHFSERVCWLPHTRLCFSAPADAPPVAPLPALQTGQVSFGSFQPLGRIGPEVLRCWAAILASVPQARLRLQAAPWDDAATCQQWRLRAHRFGIAPQRVVLHGKQHRQAYLAAHAEVDLILDTFPYAGGAKTCEALWMGVPTLTLRGQRMLSRQGAALLSAAGLPAWIADSPDDYVARAVAFAQDLPALSALRQSLRERLPATPLFDGRRFALHIMAAMETLAATPR